MKEEELNKEIEDSMDQDLYLEFCKKQLLQSDTVKHQQ